MAINLTEEYSHTTKNLSDAELCAVAETIAATAVEDLTRWHPHGTSVSARTELITGALDEMALAIGSRGVWHLTEDQWVGSPELHNAFQAVWAKLEELNAVN